MASKAAAPLWREGSMTYIKYSKICADLLRNCMKEPHKSEALARWEKYAIAFVEEGKPQKPAIHSDAGAK